MCLLEGRHRRRLRLGMGGCFAFFVAYESIRCRHVACHGSANRSLPPSPRTAAQPGWPAQEVHVGLDELSVCDRSRGTLRFVCSCARVPPSLPLSLSLARSGGAGRLWSVKIIITVETHRYSFKPNKLHHPRVFSFPNLAEHVPVF
jgi:hypothetical protein